MAKQYSRPNTTSNFPNNFQKCPGTCTLLNPDRLRNIHQKIHNIRPEWREGIYFDYRRQFSPYVMTHLCSVLSHTLPSGVRVGGTFSPRTDGNILKTPLLKFDINPSTFSTNFMLLYQPVTPLRFENVIQIDSHRNCHSTATVEYIAPSATSTISYYRDAPKSGRITLSFMESFNRFWAFGAEMTYEWNKDFAAAQTAFAGRYSLEKSAYAATLSSNAMDITYWRQLSDELQMGSTFFYNEKKNKALGSILYQLEFQNATVRGVVDSDWSVGFAYSRRLNGLCTDICFSLIMCIPTNKYTSGFKFQISP